MQSEDEEERQNFAFGSPGFKITPPILTTPPPPPHSCLHYYLFSRKQTRLRFSFNPVSEVIRRARNSVEGTPSICRPQVVVPPLVVLEVRNLWLYHTEALENSMMLCLVSRGDAMCRPRVVVPPLVVKTLWL